MTCSLGGCWADFNNDAYLDLYISGFEDGGSEPDAIYTNNGDGTFTHTWTQGNVLTGRGVTSCDFDRDNDMDIYVSNYRLYPNLLWLNDGSGGFTNVAAAYGVAGSGHTIGSSWADIDNDGYFDLFVGNFSHPGQPPAIFLRNLGPGGSYHFQQEHELSGSDWRESYASPTFGDYDNDGDLDLFFTTVYEGDNSILFRNDGNWQFTNVTSSVGLDGIATTEYAAWGDYNNNGYLDLVAHGRLFLNYGSGNNWLKVRMIGDGTNVNKDAIGTQVRIDWNSQVLSRQVESSTGARSQNEMTLHFGLGSHSNPVNLDVFWPGGSTQTVNGVTVNQTIEVIYGSGLVTTTSTTSTTTTTMPGLMGHWKLDDGNGMVAHDSSGRGHDGNLVNMEEGDWTEGRIIGALQFDGDNEYVNMGSESDFDVLRVSISAWVKPDTSASSQHPAGILTKVAEQYYSLDLDMRDENPKVYFSIDGGGGGGYVTTPSGVPNDVWTHVVATYGTNEYMNIYTNAVLAQSGVSSKGEIEPSTQELLMGRNPGYTIDGSSWDNYFAGTIDDVWLFDYGLSAGEVNTLYLAGSTTTTTSTTSTSSATTSTSTTSTTTTSTTSTTAAVLPIGHWKLDDGSGITALDSSGRDNHGTLTNMEQADWVTGQVGGALAFDGSDDYVNMGNSSDFNVPQVSITAWVKPDTVTSSDNPAGILARVGEEYFCLAVDMRDSDPRVYFSVNGGGAGGYITTPAGIPNDVWTHVAATYDAGHDFKIYTNAALSVNAHSTKGDINGSTKELLIGRNPGYSLPGTYWDHYFAGVIDDVRLYDDAIDLAKINDIFLGIPDEMPEALMLIVR